MWGSLALPSNHVAVGVECRVASRAVASRGAGKVQPPTPKTQPKVLVFCKSELLGFEHVMMCTGFPFVHFSFDDKSLAGFSTLHQCHLVFVLDQFLSPKPWQEFSLK